MAGANFVIIDNPTGDRHNSPIVKNQMLDTSHQIDTLCPVLNAAFAAKIIMLNPFPAPIMPSVNLASELISHSLRVRNIPKIRSLWVQMR